MLMRYRCQPAISHQHHNPDSYHSYLWRVCRVNGRTYPPSVHRGNPVARSGCCWFQDLKGLFERGLKTPLLLAQQSIRLQSG